MDERTVALVAIAVAALAIAAVTLGSPAADVAEISGPADDPDAVRIVDADDGATLGTVSVTVADTPAERRRGLSEHDSLPPGAGMWFVFDRESSRAFHMRGMNVSIDIIFVGRDGRITRIHEAAVPNSTERYRGRARWVLEVNAGFVAAAGIETGDRIVAVSEDAASKTSWWQLPAESPSRRREAF
jgi:uncharacterized membrane protein (UPF0127 family)